jgi:hypothetical protein
LNVVESSIMKELSQLNSLNVNATLLKLTEIARILNEFFKKTNKEYKTFYSKRKQLRQGMHRHTVQ